MEFIYVCGAMVPHCVVHVNGDGSSFFYSLSYLIYVLSHAYLSYGKVSYSKFVIVQHDAVW